MIQSQQHRLQHLRVQRVIQIRQYYYHDRLSLSTEVQVIPPTHQYYYQQSRHRQCLFVSRIMDSSTQSLLASSLPSLRPYNSRSFISINRITQPTSSLSSVSTSLLFKQQSIRPNLCIRYSNSLATSDGNKIQGSTTTGPKHEVTSTILYDENNNNDNKEINLNSIQEQPILIASKDQQDDEQQLKQHRQRIQSNLKNPKNQNPISTLQYMKAYSDLGKLKLSTLVVVTTLVGYISLGPIPLQLEYIPSLASVIIGTTLCSCSAGAFNQIYEIQNDQQMKRTQLRPLITGILSKQHAIYVASLWSCLGISILHFGTDPITTTLGISNILLYTCIYTPMKTRSIYNTWIGAIVGAIPPYMGYTAAKYVLVSSETSKAIAPCTTTPSTTTDTLTTLTTAPHELSIASVSDIISSSSTYIDYNYLITDPIAISLISILYLWQLPHFMALSYMYRIDYQRGGFHMISTTTKNNQLNNNIENNDNDETTMTNTSTSSALDPNDAGLRTANVIVRYAWYLSMVPIFSTMCNVTSCMFLLESMVLNTYALHVAYKFKYHNTNSNARKVFLTSLWYLPCTLMLFLLHSKTWDTTTTTTSNISTIDVTNETTTIDNNLLAQCVLDYIHTIRNKGRELCIHEQAINKATTNAANIKNEANWNRNDPTILFNQSNQNEETNTAAACPIVFARTTDFNRLYDDTSPLSPAVISAVSTYIAPPSIAFASSSSTSVLKLIDMIPVSQNSSTNNTHKRGL